MRTFTFKSLFLTVLFVLLGSTAILAADDGLITTQVDEAGTLPSKISENQKYLTKLSQVMAHLHNLT